MSKNITIQEGGMITQLTVDKLQTDLSGGGRCEWIPKDEANLGTKHITKSGTYYAKDDGYYGYSSVTASGAGDGTLLGSDQDGNDAIAHLDQTGKIVIDTLPSSITVTTPPTNPSGTYIDGQTISTSGMVVKAYLKDGQEYGIVPINEISIAPTVATYDESANLGAGEATLDGETVEYASVVRWSYNSTKHKLGEAEPTLTSQDARTAYSNTKIVATTGSLYAVSESPDIYADCIGSILDADAEKPYIFEEEFERTSNQRYSYQGVIKEVYAKYCKSAYYHPSTTIGDTTYYMADWNGSLKESNKTLTEILPILFEGEITEHEGSEQQITVSWPRPGDGMVLETTFSITVVPAGNT